MDLFHLAPPLVPLSPSMASLGLLRAPLVPLLSTLGTLRIPNGPSVAASSPYASLGHLMATLGTLGHPAATLVPPS